MPQAQWARPCQRQALQDQRQAPSGRLQVQRDLQPTSCLWLRVLQQPLCLSDTFPERLLLEFNKIRLILTKEKEVLCDEVVWSNNILSKFVFFFRIPFFQNFLIFYILSNKSSFENKWISKECYSIKQPWPILKRSIDWICSFDFVLSKTFFGITFKHI